jgi:hypothetical protein
MSDEPFVLLAGFGVTQIGRFSAMKYQYSYLPTLCCIWIDFLTWQSKLSSPKAADNGIPHEYFLMATYKENVKSRVNPNNT